MTTTKPKAKPTYEPQVEETVDGYLDTLTGFDELAIAKHFDGLNPYTQGEANPVMTLRAVIFIDQRRKGKTDPEAKQHVMGMPLGECNAYFVEETDVDETDEDLSAAGKTGSAVE